MNDQEKNIAVLTAHMEHVVKDVTEMKADLKSMPDRMASTYVPKPDFEEHRKDHAELRADVKSLIAKVDSGSFLSREDGKAFVTHDQFRPYRGILVFLGMGVSGGILTVVFNLVSGFLSR